MAPTAVLVTAATSKTAMGFAPRFPHPPRRTAPTLVRPLTSRAASPFSKRPGRYDRIVTL